MRMPMTEKRKFYKTTIMVEVLSEDPYDFNNLSDVYRDITTGACSGQVRVTGREDFQGPRAAKELRKQESDPAFFRLDENGNDTE